MLANVGKHVGKNVGNNVGTNVGTCWQTLANVGKCWQTCWRMLDQPLSLRRHLPADTQPSSAGGCCMLCRTVGTRTDKNGAKNVISLCRSVDICLRIRSQVQRAVAACSAGPLRFWSVRVPTAASAPCSTDRTVGPLGLHEMVASDMRSKFTQWLNCAASLDKWPLRVQ